MNKKHITKAVNLGLGIMQLAEEKLNATLSALEKEGHINRKQGRQMAKDLLGEVNAFQKKLSAKIDKGVRGVVKSAGTRSKTRPKAKKRARSK